MNNNSQNNQYDLIIIGGGAAGQMAAISAKRKNHELKVAILDRTFALGRKILVCGAGRCNITNINLDKSIKDHYYSSNPEFPEKILKQFGYQDIIKFFDDLGIELYVERKTNIGKLFPITDSAKTVTALLEDELERLNIDVVLNTDVFEIHLTPSPSPAGEGGHRPGEAFIIRTSKLNQEGKVISVETFGAENLIISAGGKTYPALGSNGSGYNLTESFGHTIIKPVPSALPLVSKNPLSQELQGVKMEIEVTSIINGKEIKTRTDDVMFTQYGFSGPAILNISREISIHINREEKSGVQIKLNFFPGKTQTEVTDFLNKRWEKRPDQTLERSLFGIFPNKIPAALLKIIGINKDIKVGSLHTTNLLVEKLTGFIADISATRGWNEAEFTAGGIDTTEVNNQTLESLKTPGLYFCGEILDVDGDVGGFNLSWAWASGFVAGQLN